MSLQHAAKHLSSHGRGNDSTLVHMSPREVNSLNAIAKAHGGQLTTNPHTGLPEAGFLESILPMAAGAALMATGVGAPMAALMVGGGMTLATGSLEKGLMAGLGAYGGAGLGESLLAEGVAPATAGMVESGAASTATAEAQIAAQKAAEETAKAQALASQNAAIQNTAAVAPVTPVTPVAPPVATNAAELRASINGMSGSGGIADVPQITGNSPAFQADVSPSTSLPAGEGPSDATLARQVPNAQSGLNVTSTANAPTSFMDKIKLMGSNISPTSLMNFAKENPMQAASGLASLYSPKKKEEVKPDSNMGQRYAYSPGYTSATPSATGQEQKYFNPTYTPISNEQAKKIYGFADGGATPAASSYTAAEPTTPISSPPPAFNIPTVDSLSELITAPESQGLVNAYLNRATPIDVGSEFNTYLQNTLNTKPAATTNSGAKATTPSTTSSASTDTSAKYIYDAGLQKYIENPNYVDPDEETKHALSTTTGMGLGASTFGNVGLGRNMSNMAEGGIADAHYNLGGYSDGGRLLKGPGDGVSDSIPAVIGKKQPARLADGEFVVPARIVSELGNGSTEAGARKLYAMMDRVQKARSKTVGKNKVAKNTRADKYLPA